MDQRFLDRNKLQNCPLFVKKYFGEIQQETNRERDYHQVVVAWIPSFLSVFFSRKGGWI
jgi:hypothetical protein